MIVLTIIIFYLLLSFLLGCVAMLLGMLIKEDIAIFFDTRRWSKNSFNCLLALSIGYITMLGFAICYWMYRFCIWLNN